MPTIFYLVSPSCRISLLVMSCGMPVPPVNGSIVGQDFSLGARATYQCNPGFRLAGPVTTSVICQESGRWSPIEAQPRCVREYFSYCQFMKLQYYEQDILLSMGIFKLKKTVTYN